MAGRILIIEDEKNIVDILKYNLTREGFDVIEAYDGKEGLARALADSPDLILLDIMLPEYDGFAVCRMIRKKMDTPIIMLTAKDDEMDKVIGLEMGADDYVTKPFSPRELVARIKSNLRRAGLAGDLPEALLPRSTLQIMDLEINGEKYEVRRSGQSVDLTAREFELLHFLASNAGKVYSREKLLEEVWGYEFYGDMRIVDVTVSRLREKLFSDTIEYIRTKRGIGYFFWKE